jgi:anthranilate phosphoribosyltransferase
MIHDSISVLLEGRDLTEEQAAATMGVLMRGEATPAQMGALLVALRMKGETVEEITGFARTMRAFATRVATSRYPLVDTCGTGGDHSHSFNVSTTAAFVVAGAGVAVAKHGNRSASSVCGSADVLEALGVDVEADPASVGRCIDTVGIGFLFARTLHSSMKYVADVRRDLRARTVFNILGPLTNPAGADGQVMGVYDAKLVEPLAQVLTKLGTEHAFVVAGCDGLDELTLAGPTYVAESRAGSVRTYEVDPMDLGLARADREAIRGGDVACNAGILRGVLEGRPGPHRDIVLLNAAAALLAGRQAGTWHEGLEQGRASIDSGAALAKLEGLVERSQADRAAREETV